MSAKIQIFLEYINISLVIYPLSNQQIVVPFLSCPSFSYNEQQMHLATPLNDVLQLACNSRCFSFKQFRSAPTCI